MILAANKYSAARKHAGGTPALPGTPQIVIKKPTLNGPLFRDWLLRTCRTDGFFAQYFAREKHRMQAQIRRVARAMHGRQQNNKSDIRLVASVPARLYHRWKQEDPDFFSDNQNLKSLRRDNADIFVKI
jgi:hypothetical protein